jgi:hypothetical protein
LTIQCNACSSSKLIKKGKELKKGIIRQRYKCSCGHNFYLASDSIKKKIETERISVNHKQYNTWVITGAVSDVPVNQAFLNTLKNYCKVNNAQLMIVPIRYQQGLNEDNDYSWSSELHQYFVDENIRLTEGLRLLAGIRISPAIGNPLSGFESFSKGDSIILAHSQLMMKTIALSHVYPSAVVTTTGCITKPIYTATKQGEKATFNHSYSAIVVEEDKAINGFHFRVLNSDESGSFYDVDRYYTGDHCEYSQRIPAIVLGDEHIIHVSDESTQATFTNPDSIVNTLRPEYIVRHDSLDMYSASHHHAKSVFTQYAKYISGKNDSSKELALTIEYIINTTPKFSKSIIISSNHNEHLLRWLNESNPKLEPWNAVLYHELQYLMLKNTSMGKSGAIYPNPFELWARHNYQLDNVEFVGGHESFKIHGIELAFHGDRGMNGSRGSADQFAKLGTRCIIGHSHSPKIVAGAYQVGHSCDDKLEYNSGPSSWSKAHCIIQPNGKRQMLFIVNGKWRR